MTCWSQANLISSGCFLLQVHYENQLQRNNSSLRLKLIVQQIYGCPTFIWLVIWIYFTTKKLTYMERGIKCEGETSMYA